MAKDGTARGGQRIGTGRKSKALADKIVAGNPGNRKLKVIGIDKVQAACEQAKQNPAEENAFRQLRLNQWVEQAVRWMPMDKWDACAFPIDEKGIDGAIAMIMGLDRAIRCGLDTGASVYDNRGLIVF